MVQFKSYQITITGRVQNVGFRFNAQDTALKLGLNGFVMNKPDGSVYIEVEGDEEAINKFLIWCHKGPDWARVISVKVIEQDICGYGKFIVER